MSDYQSTFTAVANFAQLKREAKSAERDLKDLKKQQAELNAESMASAPKINQFSAALAKAANVSKTHRDATRDLSKAQSDLGSATLAAERAFANARKTQDDYAAAVHKTGANSHEAAAAHDALRSALLAAEGASQRLTRANTDLDKANTKASASTHLFHTALSNIGNNQGPIAHITNFIAKMEMLGAKFLALGSFVSPAVAALSDFGGAAVALIGTLGPLGGSLAALPQLFSAIGQGAGTAMLGFSGVFKAVGALNQATVQAGVAATTTAHQQQLAARAVQDASRGIRDASEAASRASRDTAAAIQASNIQVRNSHESLEAAERSLLDTRIAQKRALEDLETAVRREALAERSASLSVAEARANLQRTMLDPNATAFQREEASVAFQEAENRQADVKTQGTRQKQDLTLEQQRGGVEGTSAVIDARHALRDANEAVVLSEKELANTIHDSAITVRNAREAETKASQAYSDAVWNQKHALDAVGTSAQNLKKIFADMSPAQIQMAKDIFALKGKFEELQGAAAKGLLPGVEAAIKNLTPLWGVLGDIIGKTATAFGDFLAKASAHFTTPAWLDFFTKLGDSNIKILGALGDAFLAIADAFRDITTAAMPFVEWFVGGIDTMAKSAQSWTKGHGKELANFFGPKGALRTALHGWGDVLGNVGKLLVETFKAAMPFGLELLGMLDRLTAKWATAMTPPKKGKPKRSDFEPGQLGTVEFKDAQDEYNDTPFVKFQTFLKDSLPTLQAAGHLIGVIAGAWVTLTKQGQGTTPGIFTALADQLVPAIVTLLGVLGNNAPALIHFLSQLADVLLKLLGSENGGTFKIALSILDTLATTLNKLLDMKGIGTLAKDLFLVAAALKAISLVGKFTGISGVVGGAISIPGRLRATRAGYGAGAGGGEYENPSMVVDPRTGRPLNEHQQRSYTRGRTVGRVRSWFGGGGGNEVDDLGYDAGLGYGGGGTPEAKPRRQRRSFNQWLGQSRLGRAMTTGTNRMDGMAYGDDEDYANVGFGPRSAGEPKTRSRFQQWRARRAGADNDGAGFLAIGGRGDDVGEPRTRFSRNRWTEGRSADVHPTQSRLATAGVSPEYDDMYAQLMGGAPSMDAEWAPSGSTRPRFRDRVRGHFQRQGSRYRSVAKAIPSLAIAGVSAATGAPVDIAAGTYEATEKTREQYREARGGGEVPDEGGPRSRRIQTAKRVGGTTAAIAGAVVLQHYGEGWAEKLAGDPHAVEKAQKEYDSTSKELADAKEEAARANLEHSRAVKAVIKAQDAATAAQDEYQKHVMDGTENTKAGKEAAGKVVTTQKRLNAAMETEAKTADKAAESADKVEEAAANHDVAGQELKEAKKEGNGGIMGHSVNKTAVSLGMGAFGLAAPQMAEATAARVFGSIFSKRENEAGDVVKSRAGSVLSKVGSGVKRLFGGGAKDQAVDAVEGKAEDALEGKAQDVGEKALGKFAGRASGMATKVAGHMSGLVTKVGGAMSKIGALMMANPWIIVVVLLAAAVYLIIKHWDTVKRVVGAALSWIVDFVKAHWPIILTLLMGPFGLFLVFLIKHFDAVKKMFTDFIGGIWKVLKGSWALLTDLFMAPIRLVKDLLTGDFSDIGQMFKDLVSDIGTIWGGIKQVFEAPVKFLINTVIEDGIIKNVNKVLGVFGIKNIPDISWGGGGGGGTADAKGSQAASSAKGNGVGGLKLARGGLVPGTGDTDSVDTMLMPGEFVIRKKAVQHLGVSKLDALNKFSGGGPVQHRLGGGVINTITGAASGAWNSVKNIGSVFGDLAKWAEAKGLNTIQAGANSLIDKIPGIKKLPLMSDLAHGANNMIFNQLKQLLGASGGGSKGSGGSPTSKAPGNLSGNKALGASMAASRGWAGPQWDALYALWQQESGWNEHAGSPAHAYGIPQSLPGNKMASAGSDWMNNPATQIAWGLDYISRAYKTPVAAWAHKAATDSRKGATGQYAQPGGWYAGGGLVHAKVTPGEYVMNKNAVQHLGMDTMHNLNHAERYFAGGGFVSPTPIFTVGQTVKPVSARSASSTTHAPTGPLIGEVKNYWAPEVATDEALEGTMKKLAYLGVFGDE